MQISIFWANYFRNLYKSNSNSKMTLKANLNDVVYGFSSDLKIKPYLSCTSFAPAPYYGAPKKN
jgi:hypothetical protein